MDQNNKEKPRRYSDDYGLDEFLIRDVVKIINQDNRKPLYRDTLRKIKTELSISDSLNR